MNRKAPILVIILLIAAGAVAWSRGFFRLRDEGKTLTLYGNVDIRQVNLSFRVSGRIAKMRFEEGDSVKAGDLVAELDVQPIEDELRVAKANVDQAKASLLKFETGNRPQEIRVAKAVVAAREADLDLAAKDLARGVPLVPSGAISKADFDQLESRKTQAAANLASAKETLSLITSGFRDEDVEAARAALKVAEANVTQIETRLADTKLFAPSDGVILTRVVEPGAMAGVGQTVYAVSLTKTVWVRAYVNAKDLGRVYPGMPATFLTDSAPNKAYKGHIGFISPEAEFTPKSVETPELRTALVYRLRIIADDPDNGLRQGMPVTVTLQPSPSNHKDGAQ